MGYSVAQFPFGIEEEFICPICSSVFEDPVQAAGCEHIFCRACITVWLDEHATCPVGRRPLTHADLIEIPRIVRNLLARQTMKCEHAESGCKQLLKWDTYKEHLKVCEYDPNSAVLCDKGCGLSVCRNMLKMHDCVRDLRIIMHKQQKTMVQQSAAIEVIRRENQNYKKLLIHYRLNQLPQMREIVEQIEREALALWRLSYVKIRKPIWERLWCPLPRAQVEELRHNLLNDGCPWYSLVCLVEYANEAKWPAGMRTEQKREDNRLILDCYVCRHLPQINAIVILAIDNKHMTNDFKLIEPGIAMMFRSAPVQTN